LLDEAFAKATAQNANCSELAKFSEIKNGLEKFKGVWDGVDDLKTEFFEGLISSQIALKDLRVSMRKEKKDTHCLWALWEQIDAFHGIAITAHCKNDMQSFLAVCIAQAKNNASMPSFPAWHVRKMSESAKLAAGSAENTRIDILAKCSA
jgi:hypothetical protein